MSLNNKIIFNNVTAVYAPKTPFENRAIVDINLEINKGEYVAIVGQTGSGKSTLIQHINGLLKPTQGTLEVFGTKIDGSKKQKELIPLRKKAGLVFQFPEVQLFEETIKKDIEFGPKNYGVSAERRHELSKKLIKQVGLDESFLERSPFELSGGQKRRVAIAGILAMEPEVLILDEPTAGLDPIGRVEILELIKDLHDQGTTIILVTHNMDDVVEYATRVVVMDEKKIVMDGKPIDIFNQVSHMNNLAIQIPTVMNIVNKLNEKGYNIPTDTTRICELVEFIKAHK